MLTFGIILLASYTWADTGRWKFLLPPQASSMDIQKTNFAELDRPRKAITKNWSGTAKVATFIKGVWLPLGPLFFETL